MLFFYSHTDETNTFLHHLKSALCKIGTSSAPTNHRLTQVYQYILLRGGGGRRVNFEKV